MATNPRVPQGERNQPQIVPNTGRRMAPKRPGPGILGVVAAIVIAVALLAAIIYFMPRAPRRRAAPAAAQVPMQPNNDQLQMSGMQIVLDPSGQALYLDGRLTNTGTRDITGAIVDVKLRGQKGNITEVLQRPIQGMSQGPGALNEFANNPIKPNETRFFRISVSPVPPNWNHELPELQVVLVSSHD